MRYSNLRLRHAQNQALKMDRLTVTYIFLITGTLIYLVLSADPERATKTELNLAPVIGIVAQELYTELAVKYPAYTSYIAASYIKAVESSGARVVPIVINRNETYYRNILKSINGVLLPGGSSVDGPGNPYYDAVSTIYKIVKQMNNDGQTLPILGVCLGYEFLVNVANNNQNIFMQCKISYENYPLNFTMPYKATALYSKLSRRQYEILRTSNVTVNHHIWCALPDTFYRSQLEENWDITATSRSPNGLTFIASVEHKKHPFFGIQFHPEKIAFEWLHPFPHSEAALTANRYFYDTFVRYARRNPNRFNDISEEYNWMIYNYPVTYSASDREFMQVYLF